MILNPLQVRQTFLGYKVPKVTQLFGANFRLANGSLAYKQPPGHPGQDWGTPIGTPLFAPCEGIANFLDHGDTGYGKHMIIMGNNKKVIVGHMSRIVSALTREVHAGEHIGWSGNTGFSTAPHVHLTLYIQGKLVDPAPYLIDWLVPYSQKNLYESNS